MLLNKLLRRKLLVLGLLAVTLTSNAQNKTYISNHRLIATFLSQQYGIPAPLILSVAAIESSGGRGPAARVLNNHFGIEGKNEYVNKKGHSSRYKQYPNVIASYVDFCRLLTRKKFYQRLKNNMDCVAWVKAMSQAHYSELPEEWEQKIFSVLCTFKGLGKLKTSDGIASSK